SIFTFHVSRFTSYVLCLTSVVIFITSCTKTITINLPPSEEKISVEGHISTGQPPYVILMRTSDFYSTFYLDSIDNYFVHGATVKISDGSDTITLPELSLDTAGVTVAAYIGFGMIGEEGKSYSLTVQAEGKTLTSV